MMRQRQTTLTTTCLSSAPYNQMTRIANDRRRQVGTRPARRGRRHHEVGTIAIAMMVALIAPAAAGSSVIPPVSSSLSGNRWTRRGGTGPGTISGVDAHSAVIPACRQSFRKQPGATPEFLGEDRDQILLAPARSQPGAPQYVADDAQRRHPDRVGADKRQRGDRHLRQFSCERVGGHELHAATVELDRLTER